MKAPEVFRFPNPVNEVAARLVAAAVALIAGTTVAFHLPLLMIPLAYGFIARVAAGPRFSPLGLLVTKVVVPRLPLAPRPTPGPPKRFAQAIGVVFSVGAMAAYYTFGQHAVANGLLIALTAAATLESVLGLCIGCKVFALLMRMHVIPQSICAECNDVSLRLQRQQ